MKNKILEYITKDGSSYSVRGDLLILKMSKTATIY